MALSQASLVAFSVALRQYRCFRRVRRLLRLFFVLAVFRPEVVSAIATEMLNPGIGNAEKLRNT